ncbi:DUF1488 domain-containing protein [Aquibium microcysteis]|uniref:DUF1488 domain-containing protein n=1 Tax=Aquibium microcysteis TaxID=675281 RepID=UPI00165D187C|nr:DUF1488 domain-containing protein [Aquibium microcysteis]
MSLEFPNRSRSFDDARRAVRFSGYDGMFEVRFFVEADALSLRNVSPAGDVDLEDTCLAAFDAQRPSIQDVARSICASTRRVSYTLTSADLR